MNNKYWRGALVFVLVASMMLGFSLAAMAGEDNATLYVSYCGEEESYRVHVSGQRASHFNIEEDVTTVECLTVTAARLVLDDGTIYDWGGQGSNYADLSGYDEGLWHWVLTGGKDPQLVLSDSEGFYNPGSICVIKEDTSGNLLEGWDFLLTGGPDNVSLEGTTGADGKYCWVDLKPGDYVLVEDGIEVGWFAVSPESGEYEISLASGATENRTFVNDQYGSICVYKEDAAGNALTGWDFLLEGGPDNVSLPGETAGAEGKYCWTDLKPGDYVLSEDGIEMGWFAVTPEGGEFAISLAPGGEEERTFVNERYGSICVIKTDEDETKLGGWDFSLYVWNKDANMWDLISTKTTDLAVDDGWVCWDELMPGLYEIRETLKPGWAYFEPDDGTIQVSIGYGDSEEFTFINTPEPCYESAWAKGEGSESDAFIEVPADEVESFCDNGFNNWGWTNLINEGIYRWDLWAGAAQCDTSNGTLVGYVEVVYDAGEVTVNVELFDGYSLEPGSVAVYAGEAGDGDEGMFPLLRNGRPTTAPGQYYIGDNLSGYIWVIVHANVGHPDFCDY